jgi:ABC-2 type transport system ATP-binding protein
VNAPISVRGLRKTYGQLEAVKGLDFEVDAGEVFGLLGPNGAGKTTTVEILEGLRPRTGGELTVLGFDPGTQKNQLKDRIGVCLQATNLPEKIRVGEALELFAAFYTRTVDGEQLLSRLQLWEKRNHFYGTLSGGQKQRLAIALALINDPQLLFLDEPTSGLDPQARLEIRSLIEELRREKRTILLTTHYIEEAEKLCDRVAIVDEGRIVAMGSPRELQEKNLVVTMLLGFFISMKLFRWEKEEKIRSSAKLWLVAVLLPFLALGGYQAYSRENLGKAKILDRDLRRSRTMLIGNARIFVGDGKVIESGGVLVRNGRIAEVYEGTVPEAKDVKAEAIEAAGKTLLPGLIDVHVHLIATGGLPSAPRDSKEFNPERDMLRELAAYLYNGITTVKSAGDPLGIVLKVRAAIQSGEKSGADLFLCGPLFATEGGHGTEYFKQLPATMRAMAEREFVRLPKTPEEARAQVDALKHAGVDGIKAVLDSGAGGVVFNRLDVSIVRAIADQAHADSLPVVVHTGDSHDVSDALSARVDGIEHGSFRDDISEAVFAQMKRQGTAYDPTLSVAEGLAQFAAGHAELLDRSLVQQVAPRALLEATKTALTSADMADMRTALKSFPMDLKIGEANLARAYKSRVMLVTGSDAGNLLVFHGPTVHRELQLWRQAGIPAAAALQAATYNAARLLHAEKRIGSIRKGLDADLLIVDGNPLEDIQVTERISLVMSKGERVDRSELFDQK